MTVHHPRVLVSDRRLVDVARRAGGRDRQRQLLMATIGGCWAAQVQGAMANTLLLSVGPARCSDIVVEACWTPAAAAAALARPEFAHLSQERITIALAGYDAALATLGHAALLLAHCLVLWPQVETSLRWNLS